LLFFDQKDKFVLMEGDFFCSANFPRKLSLVAHDQAKIDKRAEIQNFIRLCHSQKHTFVKKLI